MLRRTVQRGYGTKSCGCLRSENGRRYVASFGVPAPLKLPPGIAARRSLFSRYARHARKREIEWVLSWEEFKALVIQPCLYCGAPPGQVARFPSHNGTFTYTGLDRADNAGGYTPGNTVPCCGICNFMKRTLGVDEFLAHVARIHHHQGGCRAVAV